MFDISYWGKRPLNRVFKSHFWPSHIWCQTEHKHVQTNHRGKEPGHDVRSMGRLTPNRRAKRLMKQVPSIRLFLPPGKIALPANFDLRNVNGVNYCSPAPNQLSEGSCTGHGFRNARGPAKRIAGTFQGEASRRMIYEDAKHRGGVTEGAYMIDIMNAAKEDGDAREQYEPYYENDPQRCNVWPPINPDSLVDAKNWRITDFADCMIDADGSPAADPIYNIMAAIYFDGKPVVVQGGADAGTPWGQSWMDAWLGGVMPLPVDNDPIAGGHSYAIIGWETHSDGSIWFIAENSWGTQNAMAGFFIFPTETVVCVNWNNNGGCEIYRMIDGPSVMCDDGYHYNVDTKQCEADGAGPGPGPDCNAQLQADALACAKYQNDIWNGILCIVNAYLTFFMCQFKLAYKMSHSMGYVMEGGKKKKQLTVKITEA